MTRSNLFPMFPVFCSDPEVFRPVWSLANGTLPAAKFRIMHWKWSVQSFFFCRAYVSCGWIKIHLEWILGGSERCNCHRCSLISAFARVKPKGMIVSNVCTMFLRGVLDVVPLFDVFVTLSEETCPMKPDIHLFLFLLYFVVSKVSFCGWEVMTITEQSHLKEEVVTNTCSQSMWFYLHYRVLQER